jgi:hypothetical protein
MIEPRNRQPHALGDLGIEIEHADGVLETDLNGAVMSALCGLTGEKPAVSQGLPTISAVFDPLSLEPISGVRSILSGKLAFKYRTVDVEVALSPDELLRLLAHDLWPDECLGLRKHCGQFHEIHDDFYDPKTGLATDHATAVNASGAPTAGGRKRSLVINLNQ